MCGIIVEINKKKKKGKKIGFANSFIIDQYQDQFSRGQKGFGIIRIDSKGKTEVERACEPTKFLLDLYLKNSPIIVAHHRMPTSTDNKLEQTHPMFIENDLLEHDYLIIHNGVISNDEDLHKKHLELGFEYKTEYTELYTSHSTYGKQKWNDSEALAIELALFIEGKIEAIGTENAAAFVIVQTNKKTLKAENIFFGKNGWSSDLNISTDDGRIRLSSEGEGEKVKENQLFCLDLKNNEMTLKNKEIKFVKREIPKIAEPAKETAQTKLPMTIIVNGEPVKLAQKIPRKWVDPEEKVEIDYDNLPPYASTGYIEECTSSFEETLAQCTSDEIEYNLGEALDSELEKISEILLDYKNILLREQLKEKQENYYSAQVFRIIKAMKNLVDVSEKDYEEKKIAEKEEEKAEALRELDESWNGPHHRSHNQKETEENYNRILNNMEFEGRADIEEHYRKHSKVMGFDNLNENDD